MHDFDGHFWGMHFMWWIIWIVLIIWIFMLLFNPPFRRFQKEDPLDILKRRFANGELSKEEYEESKKILLKDENLWKE